MIFFHDFFYFIFKKGIDASAAATKRMMNSENLWIVDPLDGTTNFGSLLLFFKNIF